MSLADKTESEAERDALRYRALHPYLRGCMAVEHGMHVLRLGERTIPTGMVEGWTGVMIDAAADYAVCVQHGRLPRGADSPTGAPVPAVDFSRSSPDALTPIGAPPADEGLRAALAQIRNALYVMSTRMEGKSVQDSYVEGYRLLFNYLDKTERALAAVSPLPRTGSAE